MLGCVCFSRRIGGRTLGRDKSVLTVIRLENAGKSNLSAHYRIDGQAAA
jgi:hypothetical protein